MKTHVSLVDFAKNVSASIVNNVDELGLVDFVCEKCECKHGEQRR